VNRAQALLAEAGLITLAALDAVFNKPTEYWDIGVVVLAVGALLFHRRWPVPVFVLTLPALVLVGSVIATLFALYAVAVRYSHRVLLAACGLVAAVGYFFPGLEFSYSRTDTVLTAMNNAGVVVGWTCNTVKCSGFRGTRESGLALIPGEARGINDIGQVVGSEGADAYLWEEATGYRALPKPDGSGICLARAINNAGVIVGFCDGPNGGAVAWYPGEGGYAAASLQSLIPDPPANRPPCGGELCFYTLTADAINDLGQIVVRMGAWPYGYIEDADLMLLTPIVSASSAVAGSRPRVFK